MFYNLSVMLESVRDKVLSGERLSRSDAVALFQSNDIFSIGRMASAVSEAKNGREAYFIVNRHINPTNICVNRCKFCAFSRSKGEEGAFELTIDDILSRLAKSFNAAYPITEVHIVGGLHPDWPLAHYLSLLATIKEKYPSIAIKAFTAVEIDHMSRISGFSLDETLEALKRSGLDLMPGGGAEIFAEETRHKLCPEKISGSRWLEIMEAAHKAGIKTNATML